MIKLDKMYQGIIWTVKIKGHAREAIIDFMHNYTDTPKKYYTDAIIDQIMEQTMVEAARENSHPASILSEYFYYRKGPWNYSHFEAMCAVLEMLQVYEKKPDTDDWYYINGFSKVMEEFR